jgi:hypothetical protein
LSLELTPLDYGSVSVGDDLDDFRAAVSFDPRCFHLIAPGADLHRSGNSYTMLITGIRVCDARTAA